jgi:phosphate transport system permease protein
VTTTLHEATAAEPVATPAPIVTPTVDEQRPSRPRSWRLPDVLEVAACVIAAACGAASLILVLDWHGLNVRHPGGVPIAWPSLTATIIWLAAFLALYRAVVSSSQGAIVATDRMMTVIIGLGSAVAVGALVWVLVYAIQKGVGIIDWTFLTHDVSTAGPNDPGAGVGHAIIGTLEQVGIATLVAVPVAVLTAVYLHEVRGPFSPVLRFVVDAMSGLPSIVAGLIVYTIWIRELERGFSGVAASAALVIIMLPLVTRTTEEMLRTVPPALREASMALGAPLWRTTLRVVLPAARPGIVTGAILGVARASGETAPVLLTASYIANYRRNPFESGPQADLPTFIWINLRAANANLVERAWGAAVTLLFLVLILFVLARVVSSLGNRKGRRA